VVKQAIAVVVATGEFSLELSTISAVPTALSDYMSNREPIDPDKRA
jgi:hypothetical protein